MAAARIHETADSTWDKTMAVNARSIFLGCKHVIGQMMKQDDMPFGDRGWIINLSSIFGLVGGYNNSMSACPGYERERASSDDILQAPTRLPRAQ